MIEMIEKEKLRDILNFIDNKFDSLSDSLTGIGVTELERAREQIKSRLDRELEVVYKVQEYLVEFDYGPVDLKVCVYHENKTELSKEEIIEEALCYIEEAGVKFDVTEKDLIGITTKLRY